MRGGPKECGTWFHNLNSHGGLLADAQLCGAQLQPHLVRQDVLERGRHHFRLQPAGPPLIILSVTEADQTSKHSQTNTFGSEARLNPGATNTQRAGSPSGDDEALPDAGDGGYIGDRGGCRTDSTGPGR